MQPSAFSGKIASLTQLVSTTSNQKYEVTFDYKIVSMSKSPTLQVFKSFASIETISLHGKSTGQWYHSDPVYFNGNFASTLLSFKTSLGSTSGASAVIEITNIVVSTCTKKYKA